MQLAKLKFVTAGHQRKSVTDMRRDKLVTKLDEQIGIATAVLQGDSSKATRMREVAGADGALMQRPVRVKQWWWKGADGKLLLSVQYGTKVLEFAKGKAAIEVTSMQDLLEALQCVRDAAATGELDAHIEAASAALRAGFKK